MNRPVVITPVGKRVVIGDGRVGTVLEHIGRGLESAFRIKLDCGEELTTSGWYFRLLYPREFDGHRL